MIDFYDENNLLDSEMKQFACELAENAIEVLELPYEVEVSLNIVTPEEIREINLEQREIDKVTDVLSFPMLFFDYPMQQEAFEEQAQTAINPETDRLFLGDIVLCYDRAKEQAEEYNHSLKREVGFLIVHSLLHLLGYDHMTEEEEKEMFGRQEEILQQLNITR